MLRRVGRLAAYAAAGFFGLSVLWVLVYRAVPPPVTPPARAASA